MDASLIRERNAFKKRAMAMPVIEKKREFTDNSFERPKSKRPKVTPKEFDYKSSAGSSQLKFGVLSKIVKHMKKKRQDGDLYPLSLDEILDETNQNDVSLRNKHWLSTEALLNNPKIEIVNTDTFRFLPSLTTVKDRKTLLRLLDKNDQEGLGGTAMDDVEESVPRYKKTLRHLDDQISIITRPIDKKQIIFYNDKSYKIDIEDELMKLWRGVSVEGMDEGKIEDYLNKQGISSMQDAGLKTVQPLKRKTNRKGKLLKRNNDHVSDILKDYTGK